MKSQMRRASVSIPSNIAEGSGRNSTSQFLYFLGMAQGSARELETESILAFDMELMAKENSDLLVEKTMEIQKMISGLISSLEKKLPPGKNQ